MKTEFAQSAVELQRLSFNVERNSTMLSRLFARIVLGTILFGLFCCFDSQANAIANGSVNSSSNYEDEESYIFDDMDETTVEDCAEEALFDDSSSEFRKSASTEAASDDAEQKGSSDGAASGKDSSFEDSAKKVRDDFVHQFEVDISKDYSCNPYFRITGLCLATVFVMGIILPLLHRMLSGASPFYLIKTRFYEIPCMRVMFHIMKYFCYACIIEGAIFTLVLVYKMYEAHWNVSIGGQAFAMLMFTLILVAINKLIFIPLSTLPDPLPPCHDSIRNITRSNQVSRRHLNCLGAESFPEMLIYGKRLGLWVRRALVVVLTTPFILLLIWFVIGVTEADKKWKCAEMFCAYAGMFYANFVNSMMNCMSTLPVISPDIFVPSFVCLSFLFLYLICTDTSYLIIRFPVKLILLSLLAFGLFCCFCMAYQDSTSRMAFLGVLDFIFAYRLYGDLYWASNYLNEHRTKKPIAENFDQIYPQAAEIKQRRDCELPELNMDEIALRIQQGLHNVEKYSFMAVRNMIRFIGLIHVEQERFAAVRIRFMTVRRELTERYRGGTFGFGAIEEVPLWDEARFPLNPPDGYVNDETTEWLGSEWDIVRSCSHCCGTGRTTRTEYYTDYEYSCIDEKSHSVQKTRTVEEMCTTCGGSGRVAYQQGIITQWQRVIVTSADPVTSMTDYLEDAEDKTYYSMRLIENREKKEEQPQIDSQIGPDLVNSLEQSTERLKRTQLDNYVQAIEQLHDGYIFRSDVQAVGFWTLRIIFKRFWGKFGWFFGRTSEFYFRSIPLSLQSLLAVSIALPLYILIAVVTFAYLTSISIKVLF